MDCCRAHPIGKSYRDTYFPGNEIAQKVFIVMTLQRYASGQYQVGDFGEPQSIYNNALFIPKVIYLGILAILAHIKNEEMKFKKFSRS